MFQPERRGIRIHAHPAHRGPERGAGRHQIGARQAQAQAQARAEARRTRQARLTAVSRRSALDLTRPVRAQHFRHGQVGQGQVQARGIGGLSEQQAAEEGRQEAAVVRCPWGSLPHRNFDQRACGASGLSNFFKPAAAKVSVPGDPAKAQAKASRPADDFDEDEDDEEEEEISARPARGRKGESKRRRVACLSSDSESEEDEEQAAREQAELEEQERKEAEEEKAAATAAQRKLNSREVEGLKQHEE